jgi:N-acetylglucosamine-6-sulfatase
MSLKKFYRLPLIWGFVWATVCASIAAADHRPSHAEHSSSPHHPNIVFILTDDMAMQDVEVMPKLQKLMIGEGTTFTNYFVTNSLCCPSRSSILRGQYVHNHGVDTNTHGFERFRELGHEASTIATWLKTAGYTTGLMGKYLNGYAPQKDRTYIPQGWDEWDSPVNNRGYRELGYPLNENGKIVEYGHSANDYLVDVIARKAQAFIHHAAEKKEPFFLYLAPFPPHQPATPAPRHRDLFPDAQAPRTASFNEKDVSAKPAYIKALPLLNEKQLSEIDQLYRKRIQSLQSVDDLLETVIETLKESGQLHNTFIVFSSDNGFHLGQHRLQLGKQTAYEEDIHVPLVVRGPGVPVHHSVSRLAIETDLAPTFAEWASVIPPSFVDGRSLEPLLKSHPPRLEEWRQGVLIDHYMAPEPFMSRFERKLFEVKEKPQLTAYKALRSNHYLYVQYSSGERELYDLRNDPDELHNIIKQAEPSLIKRFSFWLNQLMQCKGSGCRQVEDANSEDLRLSS